MLVDAHQLRTFVTVARLGSFSAAAVELKYTQAAVSQQIAALESELKVRLLNRRPVTPTEAGTRLLEHAGPILFRLDAARADVIKMTSEPTARLTIGATPLAAAASLAPALTALRERLPRAQITVGLADRAAVTDGVAAGDFDLGLADGIAAPNDPLPIPAPLSARGIAEDKVAIALPPDHPLASRKSLRLADLADARWIDAPGVAPALTDLRRLAGTAGFRPALRYRGTDTATLVALAAAGHGLTLLPAGIARAFPAVAAVPADAPRLVHRVELLHGSLPAGAARTLAKYI